MNLYLVTLYSTQSIGCKTMEVYVLDTDVSAAVEKALTAMHNTNDYERFSVFDSVKILASTNFYPTAPLVTFPTAL